MKHIFLFSLLIYCFCVHAQNNIVPNQGTTAFGSQNQSNNQLAQAPIITKHNGYKVQQSIGGQYSEEEITRMARKDVNGIASTIAGVQSLAGGTPNIRGAGTAGTAYFVDGVRVYGALPIITK